ncbi:MAG: adenosylmethionine--8-amino-7-oxononanoate transaminase [Polyangiaceae bacterium]|nr:adenosylmethionine--8-amino-7-oxononanoate transaminase [Polyangiaceae bacterium]
MTRDEIVALDKRYVWHPYTPMRRYIDEVDPFVVVRAEGPYLFDADGRRYIDANSSWWVAGLGHGHPRLVAALADQARTLAHVSLAGVAHGPASRLAERLAEVAPPGLTKVFYSDDGSTALEAAIKMVLGYHRHRGDAGRRRFVSLGGAFHGETLGVTALGGVELFRRPFADVLMRVDFIPPPARDEAPGGPASVALEALVENGRDIAAFVVEPLVQAAGGMRMYSPWYLEALRRACDRIGAILIIDEVFTGYGRTGTFWASGSANVSPDILCTAKSFSGGMLPMAATLVSDKVFDAFLGSPEQAFYYGHSFCGNPLGARVALEVLDVFRDERVMEGVAERARRIDAAFTRMGSIAGTRNARALGMIGAIDLADADYLGRAGWRVHEEARRRGAYVRPLGDVVYIAPPINIPLDALDELLSTVEASLRAAL